MNLSKITGGLIFSVLLLLVFSVVISGCTADNNPVGGSDTRTITDMADRTVEIPVSPDKVLCTSPPSMILVYMIAPDRLAGWNFPPQKLGNPKYIPEKYKNLPVVGGWFGTQSGNYESFIDLNPDLIIEGYNTQGDFKETIIERQTNFGNIPVVGVGDTIDAMAFDEPVTFIGEILGEEEKSEELKSFYHGVFDRISAGVSNISADERVTVYFAEGSSGLLTDPAGSHHSQLIDICGGNNVAKFPAKPGYGRSEVSIEQIMEWAPEVIITPDREFYNSVNDDPLWKEIPAVKNNRVYMTPVTAFNWFDRPPGVNRILGGAWCAKVLYPDEFSDIDLNTLAKEFHSKYYHYELSDDELDKELNRA